MQVSKKAFFFEAEAMMAIDKEAGAEYENVVVAIFCGIKLQRSW